MSTSIYPGSTSSSSAEPTQRLQPFGLETDPAVDPDEHASAGNGSNGGGGEPAKVRARHIVDRFDGALGLLILRLVTAAILGVRGLQKLQHLDTTQQQFVQLGIPSASTMAIVVGVAEVLIALALVIGLCVRFAGLGLAAITIGALVYVKWKQGSEIFTDGQPGFSGELELLLAGVGLAFAGLGGGGWGLDRRFRRR